MRNILDMLQLYDHENEYFVYCNCESRNLVPGNRRFRIIVSGSILSNRAGRVMYEQTVIPYYCVRHKLDIMHWFANNQAVLSPTPSIVTIYDLLALHSFRAKSLISQAYIRPMLWRVMRHASVVAPISKSTESDILRAYNKAPKSMIVIPSPLSYTFKPQKTERISIFMRKYRLPSKFWVFVSVYRKHKNHDRLLQAFSRLRSLVSERWPLVLRCDRDGHERELDDMVRAYGIEKDIIWLPRLDSGEMPLLYSAATASIFPSLFEGAGLPVMEAMACGCPVAASDIPAIREFACGSALLFDPENIDSIINAMAAFQNDPDLRERCRNMGLEVVQRVRPNVVFGDLMKAYQSAYETK